MDKENGFILIGSASFILLLFLLAFLTVMLIYRKRKLDHAKEVKIMNENFAQEILHTQVEMQQQTMQYIGREIHDNVGQKLTLAALYTHQLEYENQCPSVNEKIETIGTIINESLKELRDLSKNLTSDYIGQTNLVLLIQRECEIINGINVCSVNYSSNVSEITASYTVKNVVLRILQEFLQNSLKHANCNKIDINLDNQKNGLFIYAADNGNGFDEVTTESKLGVGLNSMKKRAQAIGASFILNTKPGHGTNIEIFIPYNKINA